VRRKKENADKMGAILGLGQQWWGPGSEKAKAAAKK